MLHLHMSHKENTDSSFSLKELGPAIIHICMWQGESGLMSGYALAQMAPKCLIFIIMQHIHIYVEGISKMTGDGFTVKFYRILSNQIKI